MTPAEIQLALLACQAAYDAPTFRDAAGTAAWVGQVNGYAVLAFAGTENIEDVVADIEARLVSTSVGMVHVGFWSRIETGWPALLAALELLPGYPTNLLICGHSLGGALACLAALRVTGAKVITFGQPRVGNPAWVKAAAGLNLLRFADHNDAVPHLPSWWLPAVFWEWTTYRQIGTPTILFASGARPGSLWSRFLAWCRSWLPLQTHELSEYARRINA